MDRGKKHRSSVTDPLNGVSPTGDGTTKSKTLEFLRVRLSIENPSKWTIASVVLMAAIETRPNVVLRLPFQNDHFIL